MRITPEDRTRFSDIRAMMEQGRDVSAEDMAWYYANKDAMRKVSHYLMRRACMWEDYKLSGRVKKALAGAAA